MGNEADERASLSAYYVEDIRREDVLADSAIRRRGRKEYIQQAKAVPCTDCGVQYPPYVMDFDHVRGKKTMDISDMISTCKPFSVIKEEIEKCEVVCSNCHRERTYQQRLDKF